MLKRGQSGFSIIELMIAIGIMSLLMTIALPAFSTFLQNSQIKNAGEGILQGMNLARAEALRRNAPVRFQFVSDLTDSCVLAVNSLAWVVSIDSPVSKCETGTGAATPFIVQKQSSKEGTGNVVVSPAGGSLVTFNGLGRPTGAQMTQIDITNTSGTCEHAGGSMRCLRVTVSAGGQPRLCDPKVSAAGDPRNCAL